MKVPCCMVVQGIDSLEEIKTRADLPVCLREKSMGRKNRNNVENLY